MPHLSTITPFYNPVSFFSLIHVNNPSHLSTCKMDDYSPSNRRFQSVGGTLVVAHSIPKSRLLIFIKKWLTNVSLRGSEATEAISLK